MFTITNVTASHYCLSATGQTGKVWYYAGPGGGTAGGVTSVAVTGC